MRRMPNGDITMNVGELVEIESQGHLILRVIGEIDKVSPVINYDLPNNREFYIHHIGWSRHFGLKEPLLNCHYRASSVVPCAEGRHEYHSTQALLGQRSRPAIAMKRARKPSMPELREITTTDECSPELSPLLSPRHRFLPRRRGMARSATHSLTRQASSHALSSGIKENIIVLTESCFPKIAPVAVLTIVVLTGKASQVSHSRGQSYPRSRKTTASVYPQFPLLFSYNNHPTISVVCGKSITDILFLMASQSSNRSTSHETHRETPHVPKMLRRRGGNYYRRTRKRKLRPPLGKTWQDWRPASRGNHPNELGLGWIFEMRSMPSEIEKGTCARKSAGESKEVPTCLEIRTAHVKQREATPRYQTPFSQEIEGLDPSEKFMLPRFTLYDGKSNPRPHLSHIRKMMALWNHMDALMCRVFPSSLGNLGLKWFDKLLVGSIKSFHQLIELFVAQFVINTRVLKGVSSLLTLRKGKNKTICNYSKRYWKTYNEIEECSKELAVVSYKLGLTLWERPWENLMFNPPSDLQDLMSQARDQCGLQRANTQAPRPDLRQAILKKLEPMGRAPKRRNQRWRCSFHEERGHRTDSCRALKSFLNQLVINGHIKEFIGEGKTRVGKYEAKPNPRFDQGGDDKANPMADEEEDLPLGTIHMISGPHHSNLENRIQGEIGMVRQMHEVLSVHSSAKKPRVVAAKLGSLMFTNADLDRMQHPHSDPLVIQLRMNNYDVRQVLVDTRSSVEVMYYDLFKQLKLTQSNLRPAKAPLVGFNAQSHWPLGTVTLSVRAGYYRHPLPI
ncbi:DEAD-box ATP-dependent RNA helicase [Actinidia chinensis var. chinensis]|uniref:DEAD-box ATP-dependent RNA helicase n=1 Tax=Actinidia chinensis var. chinensis TaxID=1590841 RepID=A0A2R6PBG0_ACTCC|nr:DEAD-box ATP-dependent RNA helicase [Actinidia chinensis var. chinensis]